jgi:sugar phosphate isomerase/epimerase
MKRMNVGVRLESLGLPLRKGLAEASRMAAEGVQLDAAGDLHPDQLSQTGRREFKNLLRVYNLGLSAIGCPLRRCLDTAEEQDARLEYVRKVMTLAYDLGPRVVVIEAGQVPEKEDNAPARRLREGLLDLGRHGDRIGVTLALETGLESGEVLANYLRTFDTGGLAANLDPANLLMHNFDPLRAAADLAGKVAHVHARDARRGSASRASQEVPLGAGDVDWLALTEALHESEYRGWLVVERLQGNDMIGDVERGVGFLRRFLTA